MQHIFMEAYIWARDCGGHSEESEMNKTWLLHARSLQVGSEGWVAVG